MIKRIVGAGAVAVLAMTVVACTPKHETSAPAASSAPTTPTAPATSPSVRTSSASGTPTPGPTQTATGEPSPSASASSSSTQDWSSEANARFGFVAAIPPGWGVGDSSPNGDGFTATGPNGATVTYTGANVLYDPATTDQCQVSRQTLTQAGVQITYASVTDTGCVVSGTQGDKIVYARAWMGQASRVDMQWTYAASDKDTIDAYVAHAGDAMKPGDLNSSH